MGQSAMSRLKCELEKSLNIVLFSFKFGFCFPPLWWGGAAHFALYRRLAVIPRLRENHIRLWPCATSMYFSSVRPDCMSWMIFSRITVVTPTARSIQLFVWKDVYRGRMSLVLYIHIVKALRLIVVVCRLSPSLYIFFLLLLLILLFSFDRVGHQEAGEALEGLCPRVTLNPIKIRGNSFVQL